MPAIPILAVLSLIVHVILYIHTWREKHGPENGRALSRTSLVLVWVVFGLDALGIGLLVLLLCLFSGLWYYILLYVLAGLLILLLVLGLLSQWFSLRRFLLWLCCAVAVGGGLWGVDRYERYIDSITLREYFDYHTYSPFREDSLVRTLDKPASLRFSEDDDLPRMDGATALYPVYAAFCRAVYPESLAERGIQEQDDVITCSTTTFAYQSIVDGNRDVIFVAGPSKEQEEYAQKKGVELVYTPIGREAFVFFVHPDNPVDGLTLSQLRSIYSGEITRWDQLGAPRLGEILAYQRDQGSGSQTALERFVMGDTPLMAADKETTVDGMGGIVERVSLYKNHRNAIGFSFRFYCTALMKDFDVKLLDVNGAAPTVENIENGTYPLASSFFAVTRGDADENTLALLDWITGPQGQALVERTGYTPLAPEN